MNHDVSLSKFEPRCYEALLPKNSFIHIDDFNSTEDLAKHLIYLDENDSQYLKYFEWKKDPEQRKVIQNMMLESKNRGVCDIVEAWKAGQLDQNRKGNLTDRIDQELRSCH